jgi:hypothetical protein
MNTPIVTELPLGLVMNYVECDLAPDLSLPQWRRTRAAARRRPRLSLRGHRAPVRHRAGHGVSRAQA